MGVHFFCLYSCSNLKSYKDVADLFHSFHNNRLRFDFTLNVLSKQMSRTADVSREDTQGAKETY